MQKLWPAYLLASTPTCCNTSRTFFTKRSFVRFLPSLKTLTCRHKLLERPALLPLGKGHSRSSIPRCMSTPLQNTSVLEALMSTFMENWLDRLSTAMSLPQSISPALKNPKKQRHIATHSMLSLSPQFCSSIFLICFIRFEVIGRDV